MKFGAGKKQWIPHFLESIVFSPLRPAWARPGQGRQAAPIFFSPPRAGPGMPVGLPLFLTKYPIFYWFYKVFCDFRPQVEFTFEQNTLFSSVFLRFLDIFVATRISTFPRLACFPNVFLVFCDFWMGCQGRPGSRIWPDLGHPFFFPR